MVYPTREITYGQDTTVRVDLIPCNTPNVELCEKNTTSTLAGRFTKLVRLILDTLAHRLKFLPRPCWDYDKNDGGLMDL